MGNAVRKAGAIVRAVGFMAFAFIGGYCLGTGVGELWEKTEEAIDERYAKKLEKKASKEDDFLEEEKSEE